jgi:hypothetical protein
MQYGFSWNWEYLSQYHKPAIATDLTDPDSKNYSADFASLWEHLLKFQKRLIAAADLKRNLDGNPWLPADGVQGLIARAGARPAQIRPNEPQPRSGIFEEPELHWSTANPVIRVYLSDSLSQLLSGDEYILRVGGRLLPLRRTSVGLRIAAGPSAEDKCDLDLTNPVISVAVERREEVVLCR